MKKAILLFGMLASSVAFGQFKLTPENYVNEETSKDYIVLDFPGVNQQELFDKIKIYITSKFKGVKNDGYNEVAGKQIVLDVSKSAGVVKVLGLPVIGGDFTNRYEINFKDEKIMVRPKFLHIELPNGRGGLAEKPAYNSKGKLSIHNTYFDGINKSTNDFISELKTGISKSEDW